MFRSRVLRFWLVLIFGLLVPACQIFGGCDDDSIPTIVSEKTVLVYDLDIDSGQCNGFEFEVTVKQGGVSKVIPGVNIGNQVKFDAAGIDFTQSMEISAKVVSVEGDCPPLDVGDIYGPYTVTLAKDDNIGGFLAEVDTDAPVLKLRILFGS